MNRILTSTLLISMITSLSACSSAPVAKRILTLKTTDNRYHVEAMGASSDTALQATLRQAESTCNNSGKKALIISKQMQHYNEKYDRIIKGVLPHDRVHEKYRSRLDFECTDQA